MRLNGSHQLEKYQNCLKFCNSSRDANESLTKIVNLCLWPSLVYMVDQWAGYHGRRGPGTTQSDCSELMDCLQCCCITEPSLTSPHLARSHQSGQDRQSGLGHFYLTVTIFSLLMIKKHSRFWLLKYVVSCKSEVPNHFLSVRTAVSDLCVIALNHHECCMVCLVGQSPLYLSLSVGIENGWKTSDLYQDLLI